METTLNKESGFRLSNKSKANIFDSITYLYILLFVYTSYSKIITFEAFSGAFIHSSIIGTYSYAIALAIIATEITISVLLIIPSTKKIGLISALSLMILFTGYLTFTYLLGSELPCGCGGIISTMTWTEHIWFNLIFIALAILGLIINKK